MAVLRSRGAVLAAAATIEGDRLKATALVLAWWACLAPAFIGLGALASRYAVLSNGARFFLGVAVAIAFSQIWSFFHAVDGHATLVVLVAGLAGLAVGVRRGAIGSVPFSAIGAAIWAVGIVWLANRSTGPCQMLDSLIYHLNHTEWIRNYPVVPGLANLNDRLGLNSSSFLFAALLEPGSLIGHASHFMNGLLIAAAWSLVAVVIDRLLRGMTLRIADAVLLMLFYPLTNDASAHRISSLGTDGAAFLFLVVAVWAQLRSESEAARTSWSNAALVFAACAASVKVTALPFVSLFFVMVIVRRWWREKGSLVRTAGLAATIGLLFLGPWVGRGVVESGYPLYPFPMLRANVDWAVPLEMAQMTTRNAEVSARTMDFKKEFGREAEPSSWLYEWVLRQWRYGKADLVVPGVLLALVLPIALGRRWATGQVGVMLAIASAAIVVWFIAGPQPRYGSGVVWMATAIALATGVVRQTLSVQRLIAVGWCGFAFGTLLLPLVWRGGLVGPQVNPLAGLIVPAARDGLFHQPLRTAEMQPFRTASGLEVEVPIQGEGGWRKVVLSEQMVIGQPLNNNSCWPGGLLRTPYPDPALKLRDPSSIAKGFTREPVPEQATLLDTLR